MVAKRRRKVKGGRDAVEAAATSKATEAASEGVQKLLNRYKGVAEVNPSNYVLLSVRGEVGADKNEGEGETLTVTGVA